MAVRKVGENELPKKSAKDTASLGDWLHDEGVSEEATAAVIKRALVQQLEVAMAEEGLSKSQMARRMRTSRPALDRLLDPHNESITLATLERTARSVGRNLRLELLSKWIRERPLETVACRRAIAAKRFAVSSGSGPVSIANLVRVMCLPCNRLRLAGPRGSLPFACGGYYNERVVQRR